MIKKIKQMIKEKNLNKGITLISLVITIIVILILAGVTITTLTGNNGLITKANEAKTETVKAEENEKLQLAVMSSYGEDGKIDIDQLNKNLSKIDGYESGKITKLPARITINGEKKKINSNGTITDSFKSIEEAKTAGTVFEKETTLEDKYGNEIKIPEGFKIASDSAIEVTEGIVIEDATYDGTIGSQFVWIPVGEVTRSVNGVEETETIKLSRYTFGSDGTPTAQGDNAINPEWTTERYFQELKTSKYDNAIAKNIEEFKNSVNNNDGYYLGRYEAGLTGDYSFDDISNTWIGTNINIVCKVEQEVYNYVTQIQAANLSRNMYFNKTFTSDLINSYAWDTALVFIQKFGEESNSKEYSKTVGLSVTSTSEPTKTGKNILQSTNKIDKQCNIFDMAGNCYEWSTETYEYLGYPCTYRGSYYDYSKLCTDGRGYSSTTYTEDGVSFRPILYL